VFDVTRHSYVFDFDEWDTEYKETDGKLRSLREIKQQLERVGKACATCMRQGPIEASDKLHKLLKGLSQAEPQCLEDLGHEHIKGELHITTD
jgi:hypothetical protein